MQGGAGIIKHQDKHRITTAGFASARGAVSPPQPSEELRSRACPNPCPQQTNSLS